MVTETTMQQKMYGLWAATIAMLTLAAGKSVADDFADFAGFAYLVKPNVTYAAASNTELKLDLYLPRGAKTKLPTLIYVHGGGWIDGSKERSVLLLAPYLAQGWAVVNVEYRLARVALAPAALEDVRCALRWVQANAAEYRFDPDAIVVAGDSAGGHLALAAAMLPQDSRFDRSCATPDMVRWNSAVQAPLKVAAVINWFGVTDVAALLEGSSARHFAVEWFGSMLERRALAVSISPLGLVRPGLPPVVTIHGDEDPVVPYAQATALHAALDQHGVPNELVTVAGGNHGGFRRQDVQQANAKIRAFLAKHGLARTPSPATAVDRKDGTESSRH
jgi:acetyl esterase/lipase